MMCKKAERKMHEGWKDFFYRQMIVYAFTEKDHAYNISTQQYLNLNKELKAQSEGSSETTIYNVTDTQTSKGKN